MLIGELNTEYLVLSNLILFGVLGYWNDFL